VGPGEEKSLEVSLQKLPEVVAPVTTPDDAYRPRQKSNTRRIASYVAFGIGGAGLITSGVMAGLALRKHSQLESECVSGACRSSSRAKLDTYHEYGTISAIALGVGVAGAGAGLVLLLTEPKQESTADAGLSVHPLLGLGLVGAEGTF
jgi:hypothetical protein